MKGNILQPRWPPNSGPARPATAGPIATGAMNPYLGRMLLPRFLCAIIAVAMLLAPAGMFGSAALEAMPYKAGTAEMAAHCEDQGESDKERPAPGASCCIMTCSALAANPEAMPETAPAEAPLLHPFAVAGHSGLDPEAETPPPRFS